MNVVTVTDIITSKTLTFLLNHPMTALNGGTSKKLIVKYMELIVYRLIY